MLGVRQGVARSGARGLYVAKLVKMMCEGVRCGPEDNGETTGEVSGELQRSLLQKKNTLAAEWMEDGKGGDWKQRDQMA